jgi:hypothetical protein
MSFAQENVRTLSYWLPEVNQELEAAKRTNRPKPEMIKLI